MCWPCKKWVIPQPCRNSPTASAAFGTSRPPIRRPEPITQSGWILSRVVLTQPKQISAFPDKLRAIQQGDGQDDDIKTMGRPALHVGVHLGGPPGYETGFQDNIRGR